MRKRMWILLWGGHINCNTSGKSNIYKFPSLQYRLHYLIRIATQNIERLKVTDVARLKIWTWVLSSLYSACLQTATNCERLLRLISSQTSMGSQQVGFIFWTSTSPLSESCRPCSFNHSTALILCFSCSRVLKYVLNVSILCVVTPNCHSKGTDI